jgi:hypothetical protein
VCTGACSDVARSPTEHSEVLSLVAVAVPDTTVLVSGRAAGEHDACAATVAHGDMAQLSLGDCRCRLLLHCACQLLLLWRGPCVCMQVSCPAGNVASRKRAGWFAADEAVCRNLGPGLSRGAMASQ